MSDSKESSGSRDGYCSCRLTEAREWLKKLLVEKARVEKEACRKRCQKKSLSIGQYKPQMRGAHFEEVWHEGYAVEEVKRKLNAIRTEMNENAERTKTLRKRRPTSSKTRNVNRAQVMMEVDNQLANSAPLRERDATLAPEQRVPALREFGEQEEIYKMRREHLKREEAELLAELERLDRERTLHIREMKRIADEDKSRFEAGCMLDDRYLLLSLIGKGGFSEVWKAFDLEEMHYVACKIHHVNMDWKDERKANYVKHALREKDIHKTLSHPRIVRLYELFTIDNHSFCTVLEYCNGNDLDFYLKQHHTIPEKEARTIIMQLVSALRYLNDIRPPIIHYDLKPANILISSGEIKLTDFGLSKIMAEETFDPEHGMELTSQGAGTYWYLPPECFSIGREPPKICSKVDVWSVGVIFYQCLYGRKPFGENQTQSSILENKTILKAREVVFPLKPTVSKEAQAFIRRCLQYRKEERADVYELSMNEYLQPKNADKVSMPSPATQP